MASDGIVSTDAYMDTEIESVLVCMDTDSAKT